MRAEFDPQIICQRTPVSVGVIWCRVKCGQAGWRVSLLFGLCPAWQLCLWIWCQLISFTHLPTLWTTGCHPAASFIHTHTHLLSLLRTHMPCRLQSNQTCQTNPVLLETTHLFLLSVFMCICMCVCACMCLYKWNCVYMCMRAYVCASCGVCVCRFSGGKLLICSSATPLPCVLGSELQCRQSLTIICNPVNGGCVITAILGPLQLCQAQFASMSALQNSSFSPVESHYQNFWLSGGVVLWTPTFKTDLNWPIWWLSCCLLGCWCVECLRRSQAC